MRDVIGHARPLAGAIGGALLLALLVPGVALGHALSTTYQSRLPLAVYVVGAAATVALSFIFVLVRDVRAERPEPPRDGHLPPAVVRHGLRALGLIAWSWIIAQGILGGSSDATVSTLFLWVYGWVGVAILSMAVGPVWHFLDPFSTLHDIGAAVLRRLGIRGWALADYPAALGRWPAVAGFVVIVWLELVVEAGPQVLFIFVVAYTALSLALMAQFGRDQWRSEGDVFTVWFRMLGRIAPYALVDEDGRVVRRGFATGLLAPGFRIADVVFVAVAIASILFDGLSQIQVWYDTFGLPGVPVKTIQLLAFLGIVVVAAVLVTRAVGIAATCAGLVPIAAGYLIAHYLTYVLIDGQRIIIAVSDPFQQGWNLFGTAFYEISVGWLPPGLVWTVQLAAVVGGHMLGAWGGHVVAALEAPSGMSPRELRNRQIPLAIVMVALTTLTLWSLGQAMVSEAPHAAASSEQAASSELATSIAPEAPTDAHGSIGQESMRQP